jgi:hypothetical protein
MKKLVIYFVVVIAFSSCKIVSFVLTAKVWMNKSTPEIKEYLDTIPFKISHGWIFLDAEISGRKGTYILDSGAPTVLDYYEIGEYGVKTRPKDYDPKSSLQWALLKEPYINKIETIKVGNSTFKNVGAMTVTFDLLSAETFCHDIKGIIGANVMNDGVWSVRYETNEVIISDEISKINISNSVGFKMKKIQQVENPVIELNIGGVLYDALVDLGNASIAIIEPQKTIGNHAINRVDLFILKPKTLNFSPMAPKTIAPTSTSFIELKTNAFGEERNFFAVDTLRTSMRDYKLYDIILGYDFLKNFNITFDWPNEMVYFEPFTDKTNNVLRKESYNFSLGFFHYDKKVYVDMVNPKYCDSSQISVADTVLAINDIPISDIVGNDYCAFVKNEKSLTPINGEPIFVKVKNKNGRISTVEQKRIKLFE